MQFTNLLSFTFSFEFFKLYIFRYGTWQIVVEFSWSKIAVKRKKMKHEEHDGIRSNSFHGVRVWNSKTIMSKKRIKNVKLKSRPWGLFISRRRSSVVVVVVAASSFLCPLVHPSRFLSISFLHLVRAYWKEHKFIKDSSLSWRRLR